MEKMESNSLTKKPDRPLTTYCTEGTPPSLEHQPTFTTAAASYLGGVVLTRFLPSPYS